ncbi:gamma-glutamylcyclotransferase family protein [Maribacter algicola]|uniref:Gamma-glutamylcyclotransferase family protein n=1 Tax=Meishania litoralis TaxID=3434685 RepID=A0ACC7LHM8_9FLAO
MEYLFSYGTLQEHDVQNVLFQKTLSGCPDEVTGFVLSPNKAYGIYPALLKTKDSSHRISGMVYEVTETDLANADDYEGDFYKRIRVGLKSGKKAWLYVAKHL